MYTLVSVAVMLWFSDGVVGANLSSLFTLTYEVQEMLWI